MSTTTSPGLRALDLVSHADRPPGPSPADLELLSVQGLPAERAGTGAMLVPGASEVALGPTARPHALMEGELRRRRAHDRSVRGCSLSIPVSHHPVRPVNSAPVGAGSR